MEENLLIIIESLCKAAEKNKHKNNIVSAFGEVEIKGTKYQIQISLIADERLWIDENSIQFTEATKVF